MQNKWARRLEAELALARRRPLADWPGWFWYHLFKRHYYTVHRWNLRRRGRLRPGLPPSGKGTINRSNMLHDMMPSRHQPKH